MKFTRREIAEAVGGVLRGQDAIVEGATIDSREGVAGALFVPILGDRDGHDFILAARSSGASAWLSSQPSRATGDSASDGEICVDDTTKGLQALGSYARTRIPSRVIAVTGSTGKTSTKDLIGGILRFAGPAAVSKKSFNNELGVPLTLVNAPDEARAGVIEMGARGAGHIAMLCEIARPTVGVVTNIGAAHRELFESALGTAQAKSELLESLSFDNSAVLNYDSTLLPFLTSKAKCRVLTFSSSGNVSADIVALNITIDAELRPAFTLKTPWGSEGVSLSARGVHQVENALAAAGACLANGSTIDDVVHGLATTSLSPWRLEFHRLQNGAVVLNDAYNANPDSMKAGLESLAAAAGVRRIAILGTMAELGSESDAMHREVVRHAERLGIDHVVSVDELAYGIGAVEGIDGALQSLAKIDAPRGGDVILVKGSRVAGLERFALRLLAIHAKNTGVDGTDASNKAFVEGEQR